MKIGELFFKIRGYTPIPFLIAAIVMADPEFILIIIGLVSILFGEFMRIWGVSYAGGATRTREAGAPFLVTNGPFAYVRNPLYIGNIFIYTGAMILSGAWLPYLAIITFFVFLIQYIFIIDHEESKLIEIFKDEYREYKASVPKFIPGFRSYTNKSDVKPLIKNALKSEQSTFIAMGSFLIIFVIRISV